MSKWKCAVCGVQVWNTVFWDTENNEFYCCAAHSLKAWMDRFREENRKALGQIGAGDPISCCDAFASGMREIDSYIALEAVRTGQEYTGGKFKYCPWCGSKLGEPHGD
jgi:hypothetical protein